MENLEILKATLKPETYALVEAETKDSKIKLADLSSGKYVDAGKYAALDEQLKKTQELFTAKTAEYDELAKTAGDNADLKKQLEEAKTNFENETKKIQSEANAQVKKEKVKTEIIAKYKPKDITDIIPLIDFDKITDDDGALTGIDEQLKPITEKKGYLFDSDDKGGSSGFEHQHSSQSKDAFLEGFES